MQRDGEQPPLRPSSACRRYTVVPSHSHRLQSRSRRLHSRSRRLHSRSHRLHSRSRRLVVDTARHRRVVLHPLLSWARDSMAGAVAVARGRSHARRLRPSRLLEQRRPGWGGSAGGSAAVECRRRLRRGCSRVEKTPRPCAVAAPDAPRRRPSRSDWGSAVWIPWSVSNVSRQSAMCRVRQRDVSSQ